MIILFFIIKRKKKQVFIIRNVSMFVTVSGIQQKPSSQHR